MIPPADLRKALSGEDPEGTPISLSELGRRLAPHRRNGHHGEPYRKQTIAIYIGDPDRQGPDFEEAFLSWRAAERAHLTDLRTRYANLEDLLREAPYIVQLGDGPAQALLVIGQLPAGTLIQAGDALPHIVVNRAPIRQCACGQWFVTRSWNQKRCAPDCTEHPK